MKIIFQNYQGDLLSEAEGQEHESLLQVAQASGIEMEGACEGNMACSTCHVIVSKDWFDKLAPASEDEDEMLDLAADLASTSRLGCQIILTEDHDGLTVRLPRSTLNMMG